MKRNGLVKWLISSLLILLLLLSLSGFAAAQDRANMAEIAQGVVRISQYNPNTDTYFNCGTGFVVEAEPPFEYIITTWTNVMPRPLTDNEQWDIFIRLHADFYVPANIATAPMRTSDLVLLRVGPGDRLHNLRPLVLSDRSLVNVGDRVTAIGWPDIGFQDYDVSYADSTTISSGTITRNTTAPQGSGFDGTRWWQHEAAINQGNNGGPLVNEQGHVVGINTFSIPATAGQGIHGAVHINYLTEVLDSMGVRYLKPDGAGDAGAAPAPDEPAGEDTPEAAAPPPPPPPPEPDPQPEAAPPAVVDGPESDGPNMLVIGGVGLGVLAIAGIVLAVVMSGKSSPQPAASLPSAPPQAALPQAPPAPSPGSAKTAAAPKAAAASSATQAKPKQPRPVVKGVSGHFAGQTLELVNGRLSIGRDPSMAQLVYPQDVQDISRKHCTISYEEGSKRFVIEDSSSNGTYLSSGQKLESGKPYHVNPGSRFYLVDSKEMFSLAVE